MAKILCVDDDQYLTDLLRYALAREGFEVRMAHTGRDALRDRLAAVPDLRLHPDKREGGLLHLAVGPDE